MRRNVLIAAIALAVGVLACNLPTQAGSAVPPVPQEPTSREPVPAAPATAEISDQAATVESPTVSSSVAIPGSGQSGTESPVDETKPVYGATIYETRFLSGWPEVTTDYGSSSTVDGVYRFEVAANGAHWVFTSQASESVFYAELTASPVSCPANGGAYGLIFQYESTSAFRFFAVTCDNHYILGERAGTRNRAIATGALPNGSSMADGEHTIGVWAHDTIISGYEDSEFVDSATFDTMPAGDIGPYAETGEEGFTIDFSRLAVYETGE